jgi:hypothetical protein
VGVGRKNPPRTRPANLAKRAGEGGVAEAITDAQAAIRRLEAKPDPEEAEPFVLSILPLPPAVAAVQMDPTGALSSNEQANPIQDLYVVNLHTTGTSDSHGIRPKQVLAALLGINTGAPINYTNGRGCGSPAGAAVFYCALPEMRRGDRILSVTGTFGTGVGVGTSSINLKRCIGNNIAPASIGSASTGGTGQPIHVTISGLTETVPSGVSYVLEVATGRSQDSFVTITVEYDHPP